MKYKLILLIILFSIVFFPNSLSIIQTTYSGDPSKEASSYEDKFIAGGCFEDGTVMRSFTDTSYWFEHATKGTYQVSDCEYNISPDASGSYGGVWSGGDSNTIGYGVACDFQFVIYGGVTQDEGISGGFSPGVSCNYYSDQLCDTELHAGVQSNADKFIIWADTWGTASVWQWGDPDVVNMTIVLNSSTTGTYYLNNSDDVINNVHTGQSLSDNMNFSFITASGEAAGQEKFGLRRVLCYNLSGAPQVDTTPEFTNTVTDFYDGSTVDNFTVILKNSTETYTNTTITGDINWDNISSGIYNVTFRSNQSGGYFNLSFVDVNVSSDLAAEMYQSILILNATDLLDDSQLLNFGVTVPLQINLSNSSGQARLLLKAGEYNVVGNESTHLNVTKTISIDAIQTKFETLEFGSNNLKINATDIVTGNLISTFKASLEDIDSDFTSNISTTTGELTFSLASGNFTIEITAEDYLTLIENVTVDTIHANHTSELQKENSILINLFAESNQSVLNWTNVTADFDSDTSIFSSKSDNGTIYLEDVTQEEYTITFSALDFDSRDYFINLISGSNINLDVYLIDSDKSTEITFTIVDASTSQNLEDVRVSVAKKINLSFVTIAQKESDVSGVVIFNLDQDITYRFTLTKEDFETRTFDLTPTSTTYTVELTPEAIIDYTTIYDRIDFTLLPLNSTLRTGTIVDFSIIAASLDGTVIDYFGVNSTFNGTDSITNISTSAAGGTATIQLNFDSFIGSVGVTYFIDIDGFDPVRVDRRFYVSNVTAGNLSISSVVELFDDQLGDSKEGRLLKAIIAVAFTIIIMATIASMGIRDRRLNIVAAASMGFFMMFGWIPTGITIAIIIILLGSFFIGGLRGGTD